IKEALTRLSLDPKQFEPRRFRNAISREKGNMVDVNSFSEKAGEEYFPKIVSLVWREYEKIMKENGGVDFDDLLLLPTKLLMEQEQVRKEYQKRWTYLHVDEYQDTNIVQYELSKILAGTEKNICV